MASLSTTWGRHPPHQDRTPSSSATQGVGGAISLIYRWLRMDYVASHCVHALLRCRVWTRLVPLGRFHRVVIEQFIRSLDLDFVSCHHAVHKIYRTYRLESTPPPSTAPPVLGPASLRRMRRAMQKHTQQSSTEEISKPDVFSSWPVTSLNCLSSASTNSSPCDAYTLAPPPPALLLPPLPLAPAQDMARSQRPYLVSSGLLLPLLLHCVPACATAWLAGRLAGWKATAKQVRRQQNWIAILMSTASRRNRHPSCAFRAELYPPRPPLPTHTSLAGGCFLPGLSA